MKVFNNDYYGGCFMVLIACIMLTIGGCTSLPFNDERPPLMNDTEFTDFQPRGTE